MSRTGATAISLLLGLTAASAGAQAQDGPPDTTQPKFDSKGRQIAQPKAPPKQQTITLPKVIQDADPAYPPAAEKAGLEASVLLKVTIDAEGSVVKATVVEPVGNGFDESAVEAAFRLKFSPAKRPDGTPFKATIQYRFEFKLKPPPPEAQPAAPLVGVFRGRILIQGLGDALAGASVTATDAEGQTFTVLTAADGTFVFDALKPGRYAVGLTASGYQELAVSEAIVAGEEVDATYRLSLKIADGGAIDIFVEGEKPPREVTRRTLDRRELLRIPGTNGDALTGLQSLPGVARPPGILGVLLVRGSAAQDTQIFVDGINVPIIYHFGGLSSVIPTELLEKIDFYPGNFSARYGRATGGIVDVAMRSPRTDQYHGLAQLDLIDARLMLEGPLPFIGDDGWSFIAAGRRSYLDAWLGPVLESAGAGVSTAPRYYDYQFAIEKKWDDDASLRTSFYGSDDALALLLEEPNPGEPALSGSLGLTTVFQRLQFAYDQKIGDDHKVDIDLAFGHDALGFEIGSLFFNLDSLSVNARAEYSYTFGKAATMHLGMDIIGGEASVTARLPGIQPPGSPANQPFSTRAPVEVNQTNTFYRPSAYVEMELTPSDRLRIVPGLRMDFSRDTGAWSAAPRINGRYTVIDTFPRSVVKGGFGLFNQPPQFQQSVEPFGSKGLRDNRAIHYTLGWEQDITEQLEVSAEGFYKQLDNLVVAQAGSGLQVNYNNLGRGNVIGSEVLLKYKPDDRFFGWVAYTLSRSVRQDNDEAPEVLVNFDQTHILTVLGSVQLGKGWEVGARFRLVSGNLVDPNVCDPSSGKCNPNRINGLFHGATGAYTPIPLGNNTERLPAFHQLDIRVDKTWDFKTWKFSGYLDIRNAYNNQNVEGLNYNYNFTSRQFTTGIPILPSLGFRGEF